jgi:TRAP-type C4-dicarboxylate transport system permease small subunit
MKKILFILDKSEEFIITVCMSVMVSVLTVQVFCRYVLNFSFSWAEQLTRILFVWVTFAGISLASKLQMHLKLGILSTYAPKKIQEKLPYITDAISIAVAVFLTFLIYKLLVVQITKWQTFPSIPWLPAWSMYLAGLYGMTGMIIRLIQVRFLPRFLSR